MSNNEVPDARIRRSPSFWKTERAGFLDLDELRQKVARLGTNSRDTSGGGDGKPKTPDATADVIVQFIMAELQDKRGVHMETALSALGGMAGFACQMTIRDFVKAGKIPMDKAFVVLETRDGETYYAGDLLNEGLVSNVKGRYSVWAFVGGAVQRLGKPFPDLVEIFRHTTADIGSDRFGVPQVAPEHMPYWPNQDMLWKYWNVTRNMMVLERQPSEFWPFILGIAAQKLILMGKDEIDPTLAAQLVMEAAVSMSKISPDRVHGAYLN